MLSFSVLKFWHTIRMHIPALIGVQNGRTSLWNNGHILLKNHFFFLRLYFRDEGDLYAKSLFDVLTIYPKCHIFQFFSRGIRMHIPILTGFKMDAWISEKSLVLLKSIFSWSLFSEMKVTCMQIAKFIFWLFTMNTFFLSS